MKLFCIIFTICLLCVRPSWSQTAAAGIASSRFSATITLGDTQVVTTANGRGTFSTVGIQPGQTVSVNVQYTPGAAGHAIAAGPLDGGQVLASNEGIVVGADGTFSFQFHAGQSPGLYRLTLRDGAQQMSLQFWVLDPNDPETNPGCVTASNPNN